MNKRKRFGVASGIKHNFKLEHRSLYLSYLVGRVLPMQIILLYFICFQIERFGAVKVFLIAIAFQGLFLLYDNWKNPQHRDSNRKKAGQITSLGVMLVEEFFFLAILLLLLVIIQIFFFGGESHVLNFIINIFPDD